MTLVKALWETNGAGHDINLRYGFGMVDANAAVEAAKNWTNLSAMSYASFPTGGAQAVNQTISTGSYTTSSITISGSSISKIEYLEVTVNITHGDWGNLSILLSRSDESTISELVYPHNCFSSTSSITAINCTVSGNTFTFGTVRHLDEGINDTWTLSVKDDEDDGTTGTLTSWRLKVYGR